MINELINFQEILNSGRNNSRKNPENLLKKKNTIGE